MEESAIKNAGKDVLIIKDIIARTSDTMITLGRVFMGWGLAFLAIFAVPLILYATRFNETSVVRRYPYVAAIPVLLVVIVAVVSYILIARKGLSGMTKPLLAVWLSIISFVATIPLSLYINMVVPMSSSGLHLHINIFFSPYGRGLEYLLLLFAFGLLCIRLFTHLKFPGILAFVYMLLAFLSVFIGKGFYYGNTEEMTDLKYSIFVIAYCVMVPLTFLILGGYLMIRKARRG